MCWWFGGWLLGWLASFVSPQRSVDLFGVGTGRRVGGLAIESWCVGGSEDGE